MTINYTYNEALTKVKEYIKNNPANSPGNINAFQFSTFLAIIFNLPKETTLNDILNIKK